MSTKSILVNFNGYPSTFDSLMPDNGLASLAGSLMENNHETLIMDFCSVDIIRRLVPDDLAKELNNAYEEFLIDMRSIGKPKSQTISLLTKLDKALEEHKRSELSTIADEIINKAENIGADFIGFKLWTGDGFDGSLRMASRIRDKIPHIKLFAGGPHVDWFMENILDYTDAFDVLSYGEGEETITLLANYTEGKISLSDIPNIIYRHNGSIKVTKPKRINNLNSLPDPVYDHRIYPAIQDDQKINFVMIDESRGCPNACYFCIHPQKSGQKWRRRDPVKVVDLIGKLCNQINTNAFRMAGSNTPPDLKQEIASEIVKRNLNIGYAAFAHVRENQHIDYELLRKSGCLSLAFGVESGSQRILDQDLNKNVQVSQIVSALKECKNAGIMAVASIIVPCPHDTPESINKTLELLLETKPDSVTIQLPGLIPGTYWYKSRRQFGFELDNDYMNRIMTYSIKLLLPPILWEPLPYKVNGRTQNELVMMAQNLSGELERNGILTGIGDFLLLIGKFMGIPATELRDKNRRLFFCGNYQDIRNMVKSFNNRVSSFDFRYKAGGSN